MPRQSLKKPTGRPAIFDQVKMRDMTLRGASAEEISREVGCSLKYVFAWRYRNRMTKRYDWRGNVRRGEL
jgi:hypothetical protein